MWLLIKTQQWGVCIEDTVLTALGVPGLASHRIFTFYISMEKNGAKIGICLEIFSSGFTVKRYVVAISICR